MMNRALSLCHGAALLAAFTLAFTATAPRLTLADHVKELQAAAIAAGRADWGHWGADPAKYAGYSSHSNRLVPVYVYGATLEGVAGERSLYRDAARLESLYGQMPDGTLDPAAEHFDQIADAAFATTKQMENPQPRAVGERTEQCIGRCELGFHIRVSEYTIANRWREGGHRENYSDA